MGYRGRFAPTPSGPLHKGSLLTALASFLQARAAGGSWLLRIDDLDHARCRPEHCDTILRQLEAHGLLWDETPRRQSAHVEEYLAAYQQLSARRALYACSCTRAQLAQTSIAAIDGAVYAGTCRHRSKILHGEAVRLSVADISLQFVDACQGLLVRALAQEIGDFVVRRADGQISYQLACVVDEQAQGITEVVRGADLIGSSFRQRYLQHLLDLQQPAYLHIPVLLDEQGRKLSKQNHAESIDRHAVGENLLACLTALGQQPPASLQGSAPVEILHWACTAWDIRRLAATIADETGQSTASGPSW